MLVVNGSCFQVSVWCGGCVSVPGGSGCVPVGFVVGFVVWFVWSVLTVVVSVWGSVGVRIKSPWMMSGSVVSAPIRTLVSIVFVAMSPVVVVPVKTVGIAPRR